jgi:hypothetical protein
VENHPEEVIEVQMRGIHVEARGKRSIAGLERLISEVAPALGLNWVVAEISYHFQYESHPEVSEPEAMDAGDARRLAALARDSGVNLVPMLNCLGHQSWGPRIGALLRAHPEFNEAPDLDPSSPGFYSASWCPHHPDVNPLIFDLFDELLDAFQPKAFHVGMDEVFIIGHCSRCQGAPPAELFAEAVSDYHGHLVGRRGVEMQMWGDRLLPRGLGFAHWDSSENNTEDAADLIPKDIVICDWHYHLTEDYPSVGYFLDKGFRVLSSGWKEPAAIRRLIEVSRRAGDPRMVGYLATTWCGVSDLVAAFDSPEAEFQTPWIPDVVSGVKLGAALAQD